VVGQLARDLILTIDWLPAAGNAADATERREQLGGKGANQAVALAQLGVRTALVAVAGDDVIGDVLLEQARRDGIDVSTVVRRRAVLTGLIVELLEGPTRYRHVHDLPLLTEPDVRGAAAAIARVEAVLVQLQQPAAAALAAARIGHDAGRLVVLDGAPPADHRAELLAAADVLRADEHEAELLLGDASSVRRAAAELLEAGPRLVAVALPEGRNLFVWRDGHVLVPPTDDDVVDPTGAGDALVAALTDALLRGEDYLDAACWAVAAAGATVGHPGARPALSEAALRERAAALRKRL
jgi:ribokinase